MDKIKIYQRIQSIASSLDQEGNTYTRADLAFELTDLGVKVDSLEVSKLIWEAYDCKKKDTIRRSFTNNEGSLFVVDEYETLHLINHHEQESFFALVQEKLDDSDSSLKSLQRVINRSLSETSKKQGLDLIETITGTKGISEVQARAKNLFDRYTLLIDSYSEARSDVKNTIADFVGLREDIAQIYREYAMKLIDIYGDSIKIVAPELFDFNAIQFLNTAEMLEHIRLKYDQLSEKCSTLIGEVSENFSSSLNNAAKGYGLIGNKNFGLIMAGVGMITHYLDANEKSLRCQNELETLKLDIKHDVTTIKGDFSEITDKWIENKLNNRLRKRLGYLTANKKAKQIINKNSVAFAG